MIPNINLLPKQDRRKQSSNLLLFLIGILTLLALAFFAWQYFTARSEVATLTTQEAALSAEREQLKVEYAQLTEGPGGSLEESVEFVERVSYPVTPLIEESQKLLTDNTYLRNYEFSESSVTIAVDFESLSSIASYVESLEASQYFTDAQLSSVSNFEINPVESEEEEEKDEMDQFDEVPRYSTEITLNINNVYLSAGGDTNE